MIVNTDVLILDAAVVSFENRGQKTYGHQKNHASEYLLALRKPDMLHLIWVELQPKLDLRTFIVSQIRFELSGWLPCIQKYRDYLKTFTNYVRSYYFFFKIKDKRRSFVIFYWCNRAIRESNGSIVKTHLYFCGSAPYDLTLRDKKFIVPDVSEKIPTCAR